MASLVKVYLNSLHHLPDSSQSFSICTGNNLETEVRIVRLENDSGRDNS